MRRLLRSASIFIAVLLAVDFLTMRLLIPDSLRERIDVERMIRVYSPVYHHGLAPERRVRNARWGVQSYTIATNSLGFKDREVRQVLPVSERRRLVVIGDSFTEGSGYAFEQTFSGRLAAALEPHGWEVFNAGVISYSPAIYYRRVRYLLEEEGFRFDELAVFLDISDIDDEANKLALAADDTVVERRRLRDDGSYSRDAGAGVKNFLKESSLVYRFLSELNRMRKRAITHRSECLDRVEALDGDVARLEPELLAREIVGPRSTWTYDEEVYREWGRRGLETAAGSMAKLARLLDAHGIELTLAVYPWPAQILAGDLDSRQARFWRAWAERHGARFVNLFPDFVGIGEPMQTYARFFISCDNHWNAAGHRHVAEAFLAGRGLP